MIGISIMKELNLVLKNLGLAHQIVHYPEARTA